jgi:hypothetical protein
MTNKVLLLACLIGVTASLPAYASPTKKKITLTCDSPVGNTITGQATVTFDDPTSDSTYTCSTSLDCDSTSSSGVPHSKTADCPLPFRSNELGAFSLSFQDGPLSGKTGLTSGPIIVKGRGMSFWDGPDDGSGDTVTLTVK